MSGPPEGDVLGKPVWRPHWYVETLKDRPPPWPLLFAHFPQAPGMWGSSLRDDSPVISDGNFMGSCVQTPSGASPEPDSQQPWEAINDGYFFKPWHFGVICYAAQENPNSLLQQISPAITCHCFTSVSKLSLQTVSQNRGSKSIHTSLLLDIL